jgi:twitching motility protein PilJ
MSRLIVNCQCRMSLCGVITGAIGALAGALCALFLGSRYGWVAGVAAGAAIGGVVVGVASMQLLRQATACLVDLADRAGDSELGSREAVAARGVPGLGSAIFDAWVAQLADLLAHLRSVEAEYSAAKGLASRFAETMESAGFSEEQRRATNSGANGTVEPLRSFLGRFRRTNAQIHRDLEALEEANERVATGASDQTEAVSRTATSVEALSDRIDRISRHSAQAADACERARQEAQQGLDQVRNVIEGMDRLLTRIDANGRKVKRLEDRSTEIGVIVELIRGISSRTDMLALNATIESIRAGEHGRGFAIVADEIRKLAERAAAATREIGTLVEAIRADTQESIRGLSEEQAETARESQRIRETGSSLARISEVVETSAKLVEGISRSTNDQVVTTQDLVRAMQRISEVTQQTQERTTQARAFIKALHKSCAPWQRLAALEPSPSAVPRDAAAAGLPTGANDESAGGDSSRSVWLSHGSRSVRQDSAREGVGSERSR